MMNCVDDQSPHLRRYVDYVELKITDVRFIVYREKLHTSEGLALLFTSNTTESTKLPGLDLFCNI